MNIDFTTTAMARPEIIDQTYASFSKNIIDLNLKDCRLFINIDPLPENVDRKEVVKVAKKYFKEVHANYPSIANHPAACNWVWSQPTTKYIFNLEDDWILTKEISIKSLLKNFKKQSFLMMVILRAYSYEYKKYPLSPSIMHQTLYNALAGKLYTHQNAESQIRGDRWGIDMSNSQSYVKKLKLYPKHKQDIIIKDIGREWLKKSNYENKYKQKKELLTWTRKK